MKTPLIGLIILFFISVIGGFIFLNTNQINPVNNQVVENESPTPTPEIPVDIKASFIVMTDTITRNFTDPKYHNQSEEVFITKEDPTIIHVKKSGITWDNFFETLPMKLTKDCLITGDGERLCNAENGSLKFFLNSIEDEDLLDKKIKEGDKALIKFTSS